MTSFHLLLLSMVDRRAVKKGSKMCLCNFWMAPKAVLFEEFRGILEKPQNHRPHPHLKLWGFLRLIYQKPQILYATLSLKKTRNFSNYYPQPQKTSNFEAETEDPHILRSWLATLILMFTVLSWNKYLCSVLLSKQY